MRLSGGHGGTIPASEAAPWGPNQPMDNTRDTTQLIHDNLKVASESLESFDKKKGHCGCSCANITTLVAMRLKCWYLEVQRWQSRGYKLFFTFLWQSEKIFSTLRKRGRCTDFFMKMAQLITSCMMHISIQNIQIEAQEWKILLVHVSKTPQPALSN